MSTARQPSLSDRRWGCAGQEVDAYWLQRRIAQAYGEIDAAAAQALAEEVLERLQARPPIQPCRTGK